MKFEKKFRKDHPETIGETDKEFDRSNYIEWLEQRLEASPLETLVIQPEKAVKAIKCLQDECWDLRCEDIPIADTGDYSIRWVVYEHYQGKESKAIGYGETPIQAIEDAEEFVHGEVV